MVAAWTLHELVSSGIKAPSVLLQHGLHGLSRGICFNARSISFPPLSLVFQDCFSPFAHLYPTTFFSSPLLSDSILFFLKSVLQRHSRCCCEAWLWWGYQSTGCGQPWFLPEVTPAAHPLPPTPTTQLNKNKRLLSHVCGFMMCSFLMC